MKITNTIKAIKIASLFPSRLLIFNCEKVIPDRKQEQLKELVYRINNLLEVAKDYEVTLAIEPEPGLIISNTNEALLLLEEINSPYLAVNLDIGHSYISDKSIVKAIKNLKNRIAHVHLEDIKDKIHKHLVPGEGEINFKEVFAAFQEINYKGYFVVDLFNINEDPLILADRSLKKLREISMS